jgi:Holliday junction resolvasome RuvABC ATP-dependent DNA helicase subunit
MTEIIARFEKGFEKGLKGKVESFEIWLEKLNFNVALFEYKSLTEELIKQHIFVNREKQLEEIASFIGFYAREKKDIFHIPVIGPYGIGKTALLRTIEFALSSLGKELNSKYYDASTFSECDQEEEEQQRFYRYLDEIKSEKYDILFVDACEMDKRIDYSLELLIKAMRKGIIITAWEPQSWNIHKDKVEEIIPSAKQIFLMPFDKDNTKQLVRRAIILLGGKEEDLKESIIEKIFEISKGIPRTILTLLLKSYYEAFIAEKTSLEEGCVESAAKTLGLTGLDDKLGKLTDSQLDILNIVLLSNDPRGVRPSELVIRLRKDKATISYYLNSLLSEGILTVQRLGRYAFYHVKEEVKPFVQIKMMEEDFLA